MPLKAALEVSNHSLALRKVWDWGHPLSSYSRSSQRAGCTGEAVPSSQELGTDSLPICHWVMVKSSEETMCIGKRTRERGPNAKFGSEEWTLHLNKRKIRTRPRDIDNHKVPSRCGFGMAASTPIWWEAVHLLIITVIHKGTRLTAAITGNCSHLMDSL